MRTPISAFCVLVHALCAQDPTPPTLTASEPFQAVFVSEPYEDGAIWARGYRYKLGLEHGRAHFQPLFGPRAPRDYPLTLSLRGVHVGSRSLPVQGKDARRAGPHRLELDHGSVVERWDLTPAHAQQSFLFATDPGVGDLVLDLAVTTALEFAGRDAQGLRFRAPGGLGEVAYSDAVAIDAKGRRRHLPVHCDGDTIRLTVPAAFVAEAAFPLLVDPVVQTFAVDTSVSETLEPKVEFDPTNNRWLVAAEEVLSATDADIVTRRYDAALDPPGLLDITYAHNTASRTINPDLGNLAPVGQFVVAWYNPSENNGCIQHRFRAASGVTQGVIRSTSAGLQGTDLCRPLVGGCRAGTFWVLVALRQNISGQDLICQVFSTTGTAFGFSFLALPITGSPVGDITATAGAGDPWVLVWHECVLRCTALPIRMQAIGLSGGNPVPQAPIQLTFGPDRVPSIAGFGGNWLVVWTHGSDLQGVLLGNVAGVVQPVSGLIDLTANEPSANPALNQFNARVAYDGCRFSYSYIEVDALGRQQPFAATVHASGGALTWHEGHAPLSPTTTIMPVGLDCAAQYGTSGIGRHFVVWDERVTAGGDADLRAATYDAIQGGATSTIDQTGCGAPEPAIALLGVPAVGRAFTIQMTPTGGFPFLLAGTRAIAPLPGCGSCQSGVALPAPFSFTQASVTFAVPCDLAFLGMQLAFQGAELTRPGGCPTPVFGAAFTLTDTITVTVR